MALIIKGDMPKSCGWDCDLWSEGLCAPLQKSVDEHTIDSDCPIIGEIPDKHGDLIDRMELAMNVAKAQEELKGKDIDPFMLLGDVLRWIALAPTIVEANNE